MRSVISNFKSLNLLIRRHFYSIDAVCISILPFFIIGIANQPCTQWTFLKAEIHQMAFHQKIEPMTFVNAVCNERGDVFCNSSTNDWILENQMTVEQGGCHDYSATGLPVSIPDGNLDGVTSTVNVLNTGTITSVKVKNLRGTHSWVGDLAFTLISPNETSVILIDQMCDNLDNISISLSDAATSDITCPIDDAATEKPENPFAVFNGEAASGMWKLVVVDNAGSDVGTLDGWTLEICTASGSGDCPDYRMVDNTIESGSYQAGIQLSSTGSVGGLSDVLFRAGNNVELKPNFNVPASSSFEIWIEGCQ